MITLHPQYIKDTSGQQLVVLVKKEFDSLLEQLDELEDIRMYDISKKEPQVFEEANTVFATIESQRK